MFGTVEFLVDRKHNITVSTGQASCLLRIDEQAKASNKDLVDYLGGVDPMIMRNMMQPLIDSTIVSEENGFFTIEQASQIDGKQLGKSLLKAGELLEYMRQL